MPPDLPSPDKRAPVATYPPEAIRDALRFASDHGRGDALYAEVDLDAETVETVIGDVCKRAGFTRDQVGSMVVGVLAGLKLSTMKARRR